MQRCASESDKARAEYELQAENYVDGIPLELLQHDKWE